MPAMPVKVIVTYSHHDVAYLGDDSLLGYLKELEQENVTFWTDRNVGVRESWDEVIKANIQDAHIALILVSQSFLDSSYCTNVEINYFLARKVHLIPIILSPCNWQRYGWLHSRQMLPSGGESIEEHYTDPGRRKQLFHDIRKQLRERVEFIRQTGAALASELAYAGKPQIDFLHRLGHSWQELADYFDIPVYDQARFERGEEGRRIWVWLENRKRLHELPKALALINRNDLVQVLYSEP
ncbi:TIR domain-containing protein [Candidatus Entotheonella palauensis]|nr:TIR domain-containing protein [Candidatus Entotheonella palauensis]